jgi:hypothetical protein
MLFLRLTLLLSLCSTLLYADADRREWLGTYVLNCDGHRYTLRILQSMRKCSKSMPCLGLEIGYTDDQGAAHSALVDTLNNGQHMTFTVELAGIQQSFCLGSA